MGIVLYSRRGCGLCEAAEELLAFHAPHAVVADVDADPGLRERYGLRVPVLVVHGAVVMEGRFDEAELVVRLGRLQAEVEAPPGEGVGEAGG